MEPKSDFGQAKTPTGTDVLVVDAAPVIAAQEQAQLDVQISTAKAYPRTLSRAKAQVLTLATCDPKTAEACFYSLPRGGKAIEGPSVRLAEIIAASYQNLRCGARITSIDATHVTAQGACHDLENNIAFTTEVKRRITDKRGKRFAEDMIVVTANAACSIALRNAIFKVVPSALFHDEFCKIQKVADGDAKSLSENRKAMFVYFKNAFSVTEDRVLAVINRDAVEDVTVADLRILRGLVTALKDNETTVDDAFPSIAAVGKDALASGRHKAAKPKEQPKPEPKPKATKTATADDAEQKLDRELLAEEASVLLEGIGKPEEDTLFAACGILAFEDASAGQLQMLITKLEATNGKSE